MLPQLRCSGMMAAVSLMVQGYPTRCTYTDLMATFQGARPCEIARATRSRPERFPSSHPTQVMCRLCALRGLPVCTEMPGIAKLTKFGPKAF